MWKRLESKGCWVDITEPSSPPPTLGNKVKKEDSRVWMAFESNPAQPSLEGLGISLPFCPATQQPQGTVSLSVK